MKKLILTLALILYPVLGYAQPPTPCNPNVGSWTVGTSSVIFYVCASDGNTWLTVNPPIPSGTITLNLTSCPTGWTEVTELNGKMALGTLAANGNVGTTGGADNITPAGTNSALTFTGTLSTTVVNHLHTLATGTGSTGNFSQVVGTVDTSSGGNGANPTQTALGTLSGNPTSGGVASYTPAGTINTPTFTGTQFDNRSAFVRVIFCRKI